MITTAESQDDATRRTCEQCGAELPSQGSGFCPKCLLGAGLADPIRGPEATVVLAPPPASPPGSLQPGDQLGHYHIERRLGGGGMGMVFAAEDLENGRCVALKVLSQSLDAPQARERFFREGRLAAAINHPNSVYVFGTEEIAGIPVIAMELVAGGTLEEQVRHHGPMPPNATVDAVLQIIAGLEAAQAAGILHRDVKPSNCFRETDGTVKVGDFGLSISTAIRTEPALTSDGAFLGTPAFSSPEQLRGEELNARSDLYSVGATLFYLLTGRMPFEARNVVALIAMILEQPTPSPRDLRPEVPRGLARAVRRCLARQPGERFKTYEELRRALSPYSSAAPVPATLGWRFLAGVLDHVLLGLLGLALFLPGTGSPFGDPFGFLALLGHHPMKALLLGVGCVLASLSYYGLLEGFWGASVGKALCRLRVVDAANHPPGFWRALGRAAIYALLPAIPSWVVIGFHPNGYLSGLNPVQFVCGASIYLLWGLLFSTVRRRNGFAALQDLATRTRVVSRVAVGARPRLSGSAILPAEIETQAKIGPYHVLETLEQTAEQTWLLAYDLRLLRRIWLRVTPPGTPPVAPALRRLARVSRLRWLSGRRSSNENWDAFETPSGRPLLRIAQTPQEWQQVRYWLADLAGEISAAQKEDAPCPQLALDRVWITSEGRAKLLDFPAPGLGGNPTPAPGQNAGQPPKIDTALPQDFLLAVARTALGGEPLRQRRPESEVGVPLPVHAREFLRQLPGLADPDAVVRALQPLLHRAALVTRARRVLLVAGCVAFPALVAASMVLGMSLQRQWNQSNAGIMDLNLLLSMRHAMQSWAQNSQRPTDRQFACYLARHYQATITNQAIWSSPLALALLKNDARRFAEQSVAEPVVATEAELADAEQAVTALLLPAQGAMNLTQRPWFLFLVALMAYVSLPAVLAALIFRGGLVLRLAGVTFARPDGTPASRGRLLWRSLVTWAPFWALALILLAHGILPSRTVPPPGPLLHPGLPGLTHGLVRPTEWIPWLVAALGGGLVALSLALPGRGLADRLAGTWPVPR